MPLVGTTDLVLMVGTYSWARTNPTSKLPYNLAISLRNHMSE